MKPISFSLVDKELIIKEVAFNNQILVKKFKNIGLYKNQIIKLKRIGNYKNIIGIEINNITTAIRLVDAKQIFVDEVK